jgi:hypothetical protein
MDGVAGIDAASGGGADHRLDRGTEVRPPSRAEAAGELAVDHHRPEIPLAAVVVRRRVRVLEKGEQAVAHREATPAPTMTMAVARLQRQNPVQLSLQTAAMFPPGAGLEHVPPSGEHDRAHQQRLQAWGKQGVARLDGVAQVVLLVRQAKLPQVGVAVLGAAKVGYLARRPLDRAPGRGAGTPVRGLVRGLVRLPQHATPATPRIPGSWTWNAYHSR